MVDVSVLLSTSALFWVTLAFILQVVALTTTWWASYIARTEIGKGKETGHYGLWTLCSTRAPHWVEDCDPMDTFFQIPQHARVSGVVGILHLILLLVLLPLGSMRTVQIIRNVPDWGLRPNLLCIVKVSVAFVCVVFSMLAAIFISIGENKSTEYTVKKSWSFWVQVSVIATDVIVTLICVTENIRYWQDHIRDNSDPSGSRAETYGNPSFDSRSPESLRRYPANGVVSYTSTSGEPHHHRTQSHFQESENGVAPYYYSYGGTHFGREKSNKCTQKLSTAAAAARVHRNKPNNPMSNTDTLTYENPSFNEHSPPRKRTSR